MTIRIGTRASNLALWQATAVRNALAEQGIDAELVPLSSTGDRSLGGQLSASVGQFIHAIDDRLLTGEVDIAVHSGKDVPVDVDERIQNLAYLERGGTADLVIMNNAWRPSLETVLVTLRPRPWLPSCNVSQTVPPSGRSQGGVNPSC